MVYYGSKLSAQRPPTGFFHSPRGLRYVDPISPNHVLVMEALSSLLQKAQWWKFFVKIVCEWRWWGRGGDLPLIVHYFGVLWTLMINWLAWVDPPANHSIQHSIYFLSLSSIPQLLVVRLRLEKIQRNSLREDHNFKRHA